MKPQQTPQEVSAIVFANVATVMALIYWVCRIGLRDNSPWIFIHILPLSYFILLLPIFIQDIRSRNSKCDPNSYFSSYSFLVIFCLLITVVSGLATPYLPFRIEFVFISVGTILFAWYEVRVLRSLGFWRIVPATAALVVFSVWLVNVTWTNSYQSPLFLELLSSGYVHIDTLFHAAISSMIKTYGIPSTGLNGIPYLSYHFGSHWIFAQLSKLSSVTPVQFYQLGYPFIFLPLFFHSFMLFVIDLRESYGERGNHWDLLTDYGFWIIFFVILVAFMPSTFDGGRPYNIIRNESFCVGLTLCVLAGSVVLKTAKFHLEGPTWSFWIFFALATFLMVTTSLTKISSGFLLASVLGYLFLRFGMHQRPKHLLGLALAGCIVLSAFMSMVLRQVLDIKLSVFSQPHTLLASSTPHSVMAILVPFSRHFILSAGYLLYRIWEILTRRTYQSINQGRYPYIDLEILLILLLVPVVGFILLIATNIGNGAYLYFTELQNWFSFILLLSILPRIRSSLAVAYNKRPGSHGMLNGWHLLPLLCGAVLLLWSGILFFSNLTCDCKNFFGRLAFSRYRIVAADQGKDTLYRDFAELKNVWRDGSLRTTINWVSDKYTYLRDQTQTALDQNPRYALVRGLESLDRKSLSEKKKTALYIPRTNQLYWSMIDCDTSPMVAPAVSGIALIHGLPETGCNAKYYGYESYDRGDFESSYSNLSPSELIELAQSKGFQRVLILKTTNVENLSEIQ